MKLRIAAIGMVTVLMAVLFVACGGRDETGKSTTMGGNVTDMRTTTERNDDGENGNGDGNGDEGLDGILGGSTSQGADGESTAD